jgi:ABC-type sugar transport system ATPase subunit
MEAQIAESLVPLLELRGLGKTFPGVEALVDVDVVADRGEVHALVGANGAGKSTLIALLSGVYPPSAGTIRLAGREVTFRSPKEARAAGITTVYQELTVIPNLSVAENVFLGREPCNRAGLVDFAQLQADARRLFERYGLDLDPRAAAAELTPGRMQMVELARALSTTSSVLVLDEPTAALSAAEQNVLFSTVARLKRAGLLVIYVSHRLEEIFSIADRVTVLRDGRRVATAMLSDISRRELVRLIVGHEVSERFDLPRVTVEPALLDATIRMAGGISRLALRAGEILGLAGALGSGRTLLARSLAGLEPTIAVTAIIAGEHVAITSPRTALAHGIVYLSEDRNAEGLFANLAVLANTTAPVRARFTRFGMIRSRLERHAALEMLSRVGVVPRATDAPVRRLSGGNQQKTLLARALLCRPRILICDEPTRGVDVGAKEQLYRMLVELAGQGLGVIVISSELKELLAICHRLLIIRDGRIRDEIPSAISEPELVLMISGMEQPVLSAEVWESGL